MLLPLCTRHFLCIRTGKLPLCTNLRDRHRVFWTKWICPPATPTAITTQNSQHCCVQSKRLVRNSFLLEMTVIWRCRVCTHPILKIGVRVNSRRNQTTLVRTRTQKYIHSLMNSESFIEICSYLRKIWSVQMNPFESKFAACLQDSGLETLHSLQGIKS